MVAMPRLPWGVPPWGVAAGVFWAFPRAGNGVVCGVGYCVACGVLMHSTRVGGTLIFPFGCVGFSPLGVHDYVRVTKPPAPTTQKTCALPNEKTHHFLSLLLLQGNRTGPRRLILP